MLVRGEEGKLKAIVEHSGNCLKTNDLYQAEGNAKYGNFDRYKHSVPIKPKHEVKIPVINLDINDRINMMRKGPLTCVYASVEITGCANKASEG